MKKLLIGLVGLVAYGQQLNVYGPSYAHAGDSIGVQVNYSGSGAVALQWGLPVGGSVAGTQPSISGKSVLCGSSVCIAVGMTGLVGGVYTGFNANPMPVGVVQNLNVNVPSSAVVGSKVSIKLGNVLGADVGGNNVVVGNIGLDVLVVSPLDLNNDGTVNSVDAQLALEKVLSSGSGSDFLTLVKIVVAIKP